MLGKGMVFTVSIRDPQWNEMSNCPQAVTFGILGLIYVYYYISSITVSSVLNNKQ